MQDQFEVGDRVRIRDWDDMADEFGVDESGDIPCLLTFTASMREFCGLVFKISEMYGDEVMGHGLDIYMISTDMIEYAEPVWNMSMEDMRKELNDFLFARG